MGIADALAAEANRKTGPKCIMCQVLETLDAKDRAAVETALAGNLSASAIARALQSEGLQIRDQSVARHRRGACLR